MTTMSLGTESTHSRHETPQPGVDRALIPLWLGHLETALRSVCSIGRPQLSPIRSPVPIRSAAQQRCQGRALPPRTDYEDPYRG